MVNRVVTKQLAGVEDVLFGTDTVTQERYSGDKEITKINASHIPLIDAANLIAAGDVEAGLAELIGLINTNIANIATQQSTIDSLGEDSFNGSFEEADIVDVTLPADWTVVKYSGGDVDLDTADVHNGVQSVKCVSTGTGGGTLESKYLLTSEGLSEAFEWFMKSDVVDVRNDVEILWYTKALVLISTSSIYSDSATNPTTWTRKEGFAIAPATAVYCTVKLIGCNSADITIGNTLFDGVRRLLKATQAQVDAGIVKDVFVTPDTLASFSPPDIDDYKGGSLTYIHSANAVVPILTLSTALAVNTWETIGPTGSGAANIWADLDIVPAGAKFLIVDVRLQGTSLAANGYIQFYIQARFPGYASGVNSYLVDAQFYHNAASAWPLDFSGHSCIIPLGSSSEIEIKWRVAGCGTNGPATMNLRGWIS